MAPSDGHEPNVDRIRLEAFAMVAERAEAAGRTLTDLQDALEAATCLG